MNEDTFDDDAIKGVVEHMNTDHKKACLEIVRALSDNETASEATMLRMDATGVDFSMVASNGQLKQVRVDFLKPMTRHSQIRGHLVALTKRARALLEH